MLVVSTLYWRQCTTEMYRTFLQPKKFSKRTYVGLTAILSDALTINYDQ